MKDEKIIHGPIVRTHSGMVYSITLLSGHVVTNPEGFGVDIELTPPMRESDVDRVQQLEGRAPGTYADETQKTTVS